MNSSISASSWPPGRFSALLLATALGCAVLALAAGEWAWRRFELQSRISPMHRQLGLIEAAGPAVKVLAVGDSHAALGFDPDGADAMNGAFPGETVAETQLKLRHLLPRLRGLKVILLQAQPQMFYPYRDRAVSAAYRDLQGRPRFHPLERRWPQFDPCCRARVWPEAVLAAAGMEPRVFVPGIHANGFVDYSRHPRYERAEFAQLAAREIASYGRRQLLGQLITEYESTIRELKESGIEVVLARYPLAKSYWDAMERNAMREADARFGAIAQRHRLRTCGSWSPYPDELHLNPDHLNPEGARRYRSVLENCARAG